MCLGFDSSARRTSLCLSVRARLMIEEAEVGVDPPPPAKRLAHSWRAVRLRRLPCSVEFRVRQPGQEQTLGGRFRLAGFFDYSEDDLTRQRDNDIVV